MSIKSKAPNFYSFLKTIWPDEKVRNEALSFFIKELMRNQPAQHLKEAAICQP
jgi:hypothetical protein